jgi:glutathione S-transferase
MNYATVEDARPLPGLRLVLSRGVLGPWGIAARAIFDLKNVSYLPVAQEPAGVNASLREWTGLASAPVAMLDDERPRAHWSEILLLAERLSPAPALISSEEADRAAMFGLCQEICGEDGLGWNARRIGLDIRHRMSGRSSRRMIYRYDDPDKPLIHAVERVIAVLGLLDAQLTQQLSAGSRFLVGDALSAADIYWAAFSNMLVSFPPNWTCPSSNSDMAARLRERLGCGVPRRLVEHRAMIMTTFLRLPFNL